MRRLPTPSKPVASVLAQPPDNEQLAGSSPTTEAFQVPRSSSNDDATLLRVFGCGLWACCLPRRDSFCSLHIMYAQTAASHARHVFVCRFSLLREPFCRACIADAWGYDAATSGLRVVSSRWTSRVPSAARSVAWGAGVWGSEALRSLIATNSFLTMLCSMGLFGSL